MTFPRLRWKDKLSKQQILRDSNRVWKMLRVAMFLKAFTGTESFTAQCSSSQIPEEMALRKIRPSKSWEGEGGGALGLDCARKLLQPHDTLTQPIVCNPRRQLSVSRWPPAAAAWGPCMLGRTVSRHWTAATSHYWTWVGHLSEISLYFFRRVYKYIDFFISQSLINRPRYELFQWLTIKRQHSLYFSPFICPSSSR